MGIFKRGYQGVREEKQRQEEEKAKRQNQLWRFFLSKDGDEADLRFLTEEPITFYEHTHKVTRNGKESYSSSTCYGSECEDCANGDRPTFKGAYLVVDRREYEYKDKDGKKKSGKDQVRLFVQGTKVLSQLDRLSDKYGLSCREVTMVRLGSGTATTYTFERGEEDRLSRKQIEQLLPENFREKYDGTMDSLYTIVEEQIALNVPNAEFSDSDEDDDDSDEKAREGLVSVDRDEEETPAKNTKSIFKKIGSKPKENSMKKLLRKTK